MYIYLLINLSELFSDTIVGSRPNLACMCGQRRDWLSPKKVTHPTPGGFRGLYIQCSFVNSYVRPFLTLASSARYQSACMWYFFRPIAGSSARLNDRCACEACSFNGKFVVDDTLFAIRQTTPTVRAQPSSICRTLPIYFFLRMSLRSRDQ